ncbi:MAG TPA: hypothetical protein DHU82_12460 [Deltaproteobacteria bacterium]|nr:hypothetical protein [Deltaproteobacteria bacterium]
MKRFSRFLAISTLFAFASGIAQAELVPIYGPVYVAKSEKDVEHRGTEARFTFSAPVAGSGKIVVKNGGDSGKRSRAASAEIELNGLDVAKRKDFNKHVEVLEYEVSLLSENKMEVEVKSCRKCEIEITVMGEKPAPLPAPLPPERAPLPPERLP